MGPNGYMDSELAMGYLRDFDNQTKHKNDKMRVLMVDGHASHCGLAFLELAVALRIFVVSYPPHTTQALQGLDVVLFAILKHYWFALRDARERVTGLPVKKEDFLALYATARTKAFKPELVKEAFRKTGAYPVNRGAITPDQMAPAREESHRVEFPADLSSPVKAVLAANRRELTPLTSQDHPHSPGPQPAEVNLQVEAEDAPNPLITTPDPNLYTPSKRAKAMNILLEKTSASFLVDLTKQLTAFMDSNHALPPPVFEAPAAGLSLAWTLLQKPFPTFAPAQKSYVSSLQASLGRARALTNVLEACLETSNAQLVLAHLEIGRLRTALKETKERGKKKNGRAKLMASAEAHLLTCDEVLEKLRRDEEGEDFDLENVSGGEEEED